MTEKELAIKINEEITQYPSMVQNLVKGTLDLVKNEVKEGRILLSELFESEDKFFGTIAEIIDLNWNSGILDPFDSNIIRNVVKGTLKPILIKFFGENYLEDLKKILV